MKTKILFYGEYKNRGEFLEDFLPATYDTTHVLYKNVPLLRKREFSVESDKTDVCNPPSLLPTLCGSFADSHTSSLLTHVASTVLWSSEGGTTHCPPE